LASKISHKNTEEVLDTATDSKTGEINMMGALWIFYSVHKTGYCFCGGTF